MAEGTPISASLGAGYTLTYNNLPANPAFSITDPNGNTVGNIEPNDLIGGQYSLQPSPGDNTLIDFNNGGSLLVSNGVVSTLGSSFGTTAQSLINQGNTQSTTVNNATPTTTGDPATSVTAITDTPINVPPVDTTALNASLQPLPDLSTPQTTTDPSVPPTVTAITDVPIKVPPLTDAQIAKIAPPPVIQTDTTAPSAQGPNKGLTGAQQAAQAKATAQDQANEQAKAKDWRVRLALAPGSNYLYNDLGSKGSILQPLSKTNGVIFPYTPTITVTYAAIYDAQSITHSNYKVYQYQSSSVDTVTITGDFTCQDVSEANYLLAVIHFFRSMTKMFYGQDSNPKNGTPPPLCYIYGMGGYQFDALPLAITNFTYNLPADVDYILTTGASPAGSPQPAVKNKNNQPTNLLSGLSRLLGVGVGAGGTPAPPVYPSTPSSISDSTTWVPTKIQLAITCAPVISRNAVSNKFSLRDYASGNLLRGSKNPGGGMW